jgi:hypothetical protein
MQGDANGKRQKWGALPFCPRSTFACIEWICSALRGPTIAEVAC